MAVKRYMLTEQLLKHKYIKTLGMKVRTESTEGKALRVVYVDLKTGDETEEHNLTVNFDTLFKTWMGPIEEGGTIIYKLLDTIRDTHEICILTNVKGSTR